MKPTTNKWIALGAVVLNLVAGAGTALAQPGSGVGGGRFSEAEIAIFYGRLKQYFKTDEWKGVFKKVEEYNATHQESFQELMDTVSFKVVNHKVEFRGEERDCVPMLKDGVRYIECDASYIPENTLDNQPTLYSFLLHEIFVYAGIEESKGHWLPSTYDESWKMADKANLSLVVQEVWMPGKKRQVERLSDETIACLTRSSFNQARVNYAFILKPNGDYVFLRHVVPGGQELYGRMQVQTLTRWDEVKINFAQSLARLTGGDVKTTVLARGTSNTLKRNQSHDGIQYMYREIGHNQDGLNFRAYTISEIENLPVYTRGNYTEFPLTVHVMESARKAERYKEFPMICTALKDSFFRFVPVEEIFANPAKSFYKQNFIEKYDSVRGE